jgi:hypothetical protein
MKMFRMKSVIAGIVIFLLPLVVSAQSFILQDPPADKANLTFRYFRPHLKQGVNSLSFFSGAYDLTFNIPVNAKINFVGSLPFATIGFKGYDSESESSFGDISLGLQYKLKSTAETATAVTFGVCTPTMSAKHEGPFFMGFYADYYEFQKFYPHVLTLYGNLAHHIFKANGLLLNLEIGPYFMIPTEGGEYADTELFLHYGLSAGYRVNPIAFKVELAGLGILTEEMYEGDHRFEHMLAFGAQWTRGSVRPGIFYQVYLRKDVSDNISGVIGIKLEIDLKK